MLLRKVQKFFKAVPTRSQLCKFAYIGQAVLLIPSLNVQNQLMPVSSMWPMWPLVSNGFAVFCSSEVVILTSNQNFNAKSGRNRNCVFSFPWESQDYKIVYFFCTYRIFAITLPTN